MWKQFEEQLVPLFEFLGIPLIILGPLTVILYILFKFVIPKMLSKNTSVTGILVANIVAQLFGEGDDVVKGITELDLVKLIKSLPDEVREVFRKTDEKLNAVTELVSLLSQAMMAERLLKPQSSRILQEIKSKADIILTEANEFVDTVVEEDTKEETKKDEV